MNIRVSPHYDNAKRIRVSGTLWRPPLPPAGEARCAIERRLRACPPLSTRLTSLAIPTTKSSLEQYCWGQALARKATPQAAESQPLSGMLLALATLYDARGNFADFFDNHLGELSNSPNETARRAGELLIEVKVGFSTGQDAGRRMAASLIAMGQLVLGNPLIPPNIQPAANTVQMVVAAPITVNFVGMTCGAIGAVIYAWAALSPEEKEVIFQKVSEGFEIGVELLRSIIRFVLERAKSLFSTQNLRDIKEFLAKAAIAFGTSLGEVTGKLSDRIADNFGAAVLTSTDFARAVSERSSDGFEIVRSSAQPVIEDISTTISTAYKTASETVQKRIKKPRSKD